MKKAFICVLVLSSFYGHVAVFAETGLQLSSRLSTISAPNIEPTLRPQTHQPSSVPIASTTPKANTPPLQLSSRLSTPAPPPQSPNIPPRPLTPIVKTAPKLKPTIKIDDPGGKCAGKTKTAFCGAGNSGNYIETSTEMAGDALDYKIQKSMNLPELIIGWTKFTFPLLSIMAVVALIYAGFLYIANFGDDAQTETAKKIIIWLIIGLLLIFGAFALVSTIIPGLAQ